MALKFSEILGQETAKKFLRQVLVSGKIPHAYLFTGISGIGKTETALAFAMALNCLKPIDFEGCGDCSPCRRFKGGNFPDFLSIQPEGQNILIGQIKDLNRSLSFAPLSEGYRVIVIHQAEAMTDEAANSFLKTLEEPPLKSILILKAIEPLDLLPTIVSRCQKVPFKPLVAQEIMRWFIEKKALDSEIARLLAGIAKGSLGRALRMVESDFLEKRRQWLSNLMKLPGISKEETLAMAFGCAEEDRKKGLDSPGGGDAGMLDMLSVWESWYRDLLLLRGGGSVDLLMNNDYSRQLKKTAELFTKKSLIESIMTINRAHLDIRRMRNASLVMEHTLMKLGRFAECRN